MSKEIKVIPIISVIGKTNSGKTTLIEKIIPELKKRKYKIGAIKHDAHQFEIDHEGKDSYKMTKAGADTVVIASSEKMGMVKKLNGELKIDKIAQDLFFDMDIIITEGYKRENKPKIEITSSGELLSAEGENLIAVVINNFPDTIRKKLNFSVDVPRYFSEEIEKIADMIENKFLK